MILFLLAFVAFLIIGIPISVSIGFSAVLGCLSLGYPLVVIGQKMVSGIDSWLLIAIPLFILAGNLMNAGKITDELFGTARELVGWIPGGLGHANVLASVIFAGMSGSASADAGGLGAIEIKAMRDHGYDDDFSAAVTAASSVIGPIFPPSIPLIIYGASASVSVSKLFMGGVIPALVMTWCLSYIERWVDRITPAVTKNFLKPMLIVLIAAPLAILLIGPIGIWIGSAISALVYTIHGYLGWLSVAIMGALWPLLVMTGMHRVFTPTIIQTIAETGKEGMVMPSEIGANLSLGGSSLAVAWKTKTPELRQTALAAAASAIMAGISEPALYGVAIRLKRPLIASLISGFICGAVAGMAWLASHSMAAPGLFTSVQFFDPANPMSIVWVFAVMALAVVLSFILTLLLGFEDIPVEEATAEARKHQSVQPTVAKEVSLN